MVGSSRTSGRERTLQVIFTIWRSNVSGEGKFFREREEEGLGGRELNEKEEFREEINAEGWRTD